MASQQQLITLLTYSNSLQQTFPFSQYRIRPFRQPIQMTFRLRPSSKKSTDTENSLVQFPKPTQTFMSNEVMTIKQMIHKMQIMETNVNILTEGIKKEREISAAGYLEVQKRLDVLQYKTFSNQKDVQQLSEISRTAYNPLPPLKSQQSSSELSKNEMAILKQTLLQERQSQKQQSKFLSQSMEQLSLKQLRLEQELREMFNRTRSEYEDRISQQTSQLQKIDQYKMRKIDNQYELMKESMQVIQKRIIEELQSKIRKQTVLKDYINDQINVVKQELLQEQKNLVTAEVKLTRQMKQSLQSLFSMISQMKSSFSQQLTETQELTTSNIKRMAMNLDVIDGKYQERMREVEDAVRQEKEEIVNFRQWVVSKLDQNREIVMGLEEEAIERMQNSKQGFNPKNSRAQSPGSQLQFKNLLQELSQWKSSLESKNLSIFKEISNSLKQLKLDYKKENDQFSSQLISLTESLKSLKKSLPNDMKKISQTLVTIFNDEFDVLAEELDLMAEMVKVGKQQNEKYAKDEIKKHKEEFLEEIKSIVAASKKESILQSQKSVIKSEETMKSSLSKESSYLQSLFTQKMQHLESTMNEIQSSNKKLSANTSSQLENFTLSMKQFNQNYKEYLQEQRKEDLKKRIELQDNMRKNASNLMDLAYKKSQFLVQGMKKAIEMNQMKKDLETKQSIQTIKDDLNRSKHEHKQELARQLRSLQQKLQTERKNSQKSLQAQLNEQIKEVKKTFGTELGNTRLEMDEKFGAKDKELTQKLTGLQKKLQDKFLQEREENKKITQKIEVARKQLEKKIEDRFTLQKQENKKLAQKVELVKKQLSQSLQKLKLSNKQELQKQLQQLQTKIASLQKTITEELSKKLQTQQKMNQTQEQSFKTLQQRYNQTEKTLNALKQQVDKQKAQAKETQQKSLQTLEKNLKTEVEKQFNEQRQKTELQLKQYDETINTLRETVWKLQAMNFSEQAKNKAIFDKMNEDLNHVTLNLDNLTKEIKTQKADTKAK